jgi:hypothetical protein
MKRNLKALGLALAAVFAFSAFAASTASAQTIGKFTTPAPVTLTGTEIGEPVKNRLTAFGGGVECDSVYTGYKYKTTPHNLSNLVSNGVNGATIIPHYTNCKDPEDGSTRTVHMNGCDYSITIGATTPADPKEPPEAANTYGATVWLECPTGKVAEVTGTACGTLKFGPQGPLSGLHVKHTTTPAHDIDIEGTATGIHASCLGGFLTTNEASLHINVTVKGKDALNVERPITVSH